MNSLFCTILASRFEKLLETLDTNEGSHIDGIQFTLKRDKGRWTSSNVQIVLRLNKNTDQITWMSE